MVDSVGHMWQWRAWCGVDEDVGMECHVQVGAGVCSHG